jgi:hypothetical protein
VKVETMGYLTGQLMSGMVSAGSSTVMTLSTRPKLSSTTAARQLFHRQRRESGHPDIDAMGHMADIPQAQRHVRTYSQKKKIDGVADGQAPEVLVLEVAGFSVWWGRHGRCWRGFEKG